MLGDADKQCQYLLFLGRCLTRLLPCQEMEAVASSCFSAPGAVSLQAVPSETSPSDFVGQVLDAQAGEVGWMCPGDMDVLDACIALRLPCTVTEVQLTVKNGISTTEFPSMLSIWVGAYADNLTQVYGNVQLPMCDDGTRLSFPVPTHLTSSPSRELAGGQVVPETLVLPGGLGEASAPSRTNTPSSLSRFVRVQLGRTMGATRGMILGRLSVLGVPAGGALVVGDSGINLLANRLADETVSGALPASIGSESMSNMMEKKFADGASRTVRQLGGKALAKADELVDKYAGDDTKLGSMAKGALSSLSSFTKMGGWMGAKKPQGAAGAAAEGRGADTASVRGGASVMAGRVGANTVANTVARAPAPGAPAASRSSAAAGSQSLGAQSTQNAQASSGMPDWMLGTAGGTGGRGGAGRGSGEDDVASQLAAMWGQQAAGKAWATQPAPAAPRASAVRPPAPAPVPAAAAAAGAPAPAAAGAVAPAVGAAAGAHAVPAAGDALTSSGPSDFLAMERAMMAEARGARGARASATTVRSAASAVAPAAAAAAADAEAVDGAQVDPLSGAPLDPLGGLQIYGGKFGADGEESPAGDAGGQGGAREESVNTAGPSRSSPDLDEFEKMLLEMDAADAEAPAPAVEAPPSAVLPAPAQPLQPPTSAPASTGPRDKQAPAGANEVSPTAAQTSAAHTSAAAATPAVPEGAVRTLELHTLEQDSSAGMAPAHIGTTPADIGAAPALLAPSLATPAPNPAEPVASVPLSVSVLDRAAAVNVKVDDAHVLRKHVCARAVLTRESEMQEALAALASSAEGVSSTVDLHRPSPEDVVGHNMVCDTQMGTHSIVSEHIL